MATKSQRRPPPLRVALQALTTNDITPGRTITISDFIIEQIDAGVDPITAAGVVGLYPTELHTWMREGATVTAKLNNGADWQRDFTPAEQDAALFAGRVIRARSAHIARLTVIAERAARGGLEKRTTRRKTQNGVVVEEQETIERTLPDTDMVRWKLEKLAADVYGARATLNVNVTDLTDTADTADLLEQRMNEIAASLFPDAIETKGDET